MAKGDWAGVSKWMNEEGEKKIQANHNNLEKKCGKKIQRDVKMKMENWRQWNEQCVCVWVFE